LQGEGGVDFQMSDWFKVIKRKVEESVESALSIKKTYRSICVTQPNIQKLGNSGQIPEPVLKM
jgi:hypothetical protein